MLQTKKTICHHKYQSVVEQDKRDGTPKRPLRESKGAGLVTARTEQTSPVPAVPSSCQYYQQKLLTKRRSNQIIATHELISVCKYKPSKNF